MTPKQEASWRGIIAVSKIVRGGWCLVGGQMVQLLCWERGSVPTRPTEDGDAFLDIRARPSILQEFTSALVASGYEPAGETWEGHQRRWTDGVGQVDILLPEGIGKRGQRRGIRGGTTLESRGAQNVLNRAEPRDVSLAGDGATIFRPTMQGALLAKAYAYGVVQDQLRRRHLEDLAALAALLQVSDRIAVGLTTKERDALLKAHGAAVADVAVLAVPGARDGLARLQQAMGAWSR